MSTKLPPLASRTHALRQSDIRAVTGRIRQSGGINLGQGICDLPTPRAATEAAKQALDAGKSIYTHYAGIEPLREAIAEKARDYNALPVESTTNVMACSGSTAAYVAAILTLTEPGDEVVLFEPFYGYHRNVAELFGLAIRYVTTSPPDWSFDPADLEDAITDRTKIILINTPANPSGKVWSRDELRLVLDLARRANCYVVTDEIYEYMVYDGHDHVSFGSLPGAYERTVTLSGLSKTYNMTGWRIGYAIGPSRIIERMGLVNDLLYICAPAPLQYGALGAFSLDDDYITALQEGYTRKRQMLGRALEEAGFDVPWPEGAYYIFASFRPLQDRDRFADDQEASRTLIENAGVASVPGRSFFQHPSAGAHLLRFCFAKEEPVLRQACDQLVDAFA